jgi:hypothetical protein
VTKVT